MCSTANTIFKMKGCAGGTICAPSYASFFGGSFWDKNRYILSFKEFHKYTYDSLIIYFSYGLVRKNNSQTVWVTWIKNKVQSSLNIKHHKLASHFFIQKTLFKVIKFSIQNLLQKSIGKSTDCHKLLHVDSKHPKPLKDKIPYN